MPLPKNKIPTPIIQNKINLNILEENRLKPLKIINDDTNKDLNL